MHRDENDRLVGARKDVPLVVGLGEGESFLASDVSAILAHTRRVIFLEEGDVADLRPEGVVITDVEGRPMERVAETIEWTAEAAEKGGYEHFMLKEIHEQPEAVRETLLGRLGPALGAGGDGRLHLDELRIEESELGRIDTALLESPVAAVVRASTLDRAGLSSDRCRRSWPSATTYSTRPTRALRHPSSGRG